MVVFTDFLLVLRDFLLEINTIVRKENQSFIDHFRSVSLNLMFTSRVTSAYRSYVDSYSSLEMWQRSDRWTYWPRQPGLSIWQLPLSTHSLLHFLLIHTVLFTVDLAFTLRTTYIIVLYMHIINSNHYKCYRICLNNVAYYYNVDVGLPASRQPGPCS